MTMLKIMNIRKTLILSAASILVACAEIGEPPKFVCIQPSAGTLRALHEVIRLDGYKPKIYGFGLTYREHIEEVTTRYLAEEIPPVFLKNITTSIGATTSVQVPSHNSLLDTVGKLDPSLRTKLSNELKTNMTAALDYEVELGIVILSDIQWASLDDPNYAPRVGYVLANDLSSRSIQALGAGLSDNEKYRFWSAAKSFPGFLPVTSQVWVPTKSIPNEMLCIEITCELNGKLVQKASTKSLLFTTRGFLRSVRDASDERGFPTELPGKGDILLTGTPGGVAFGLIPRYKLWFGERLPISRTKKLRTILDLEEELQDSDRRFLRAGDRITISAEEFGSVTTLIQK